MPASLFEADGFNFEVVVETPNPMWYPRVRAIYRIANKKTRRKWTSAGEHETDTIGAAIICEHLVDLWLTGDDGKEQRIDVTPAQVAGFKMPIFDGLLSHVLGIIPPKGNPVGKFGGASGSPCSTPTSPGVTVPTAADGFTTMPQAAPATV